MMINCLIRVEIFFLLLFFFVNIECSKSMDLKNPHVQKKLQERLKKETHMRDKSHRKDSCQSIKEWTPKTKEDFFVISNQNTLTSIDSIGPLLDNCTNEEMIKIEWRYLFFEGLHCIHVEFDFGQTLENFTRLTNYNYYRFSYRELGKNNVYQNRQALNQSKNSLTITRANLRPYIICVNFYKNEQIYLPVFNNSFNFNTNDTLNDTAMFSTEPGCPEYTELLREDDFTHNIDLCVDIDTQAHFLSDIGGEQYTSDLIMVGFITALLVVVLALIVFANFIIQKPKKRLLFHNLLKHYQNRHHNHHHHPQQQQHIDPSEEFGALTRSSSFGTKISSRPHIVVTDFSSNGSIDQQPYIYQRYNQKNGNNGNEDAKESDSLLVKSTDKISVTDKQNSTVLSDEHVLGHHLVTFDVGETIREECEEVLDSGNTAGNVEALNEEEKPSVASMSHILDDKPWLSTRSNSIVASTINSMIPNFENEVLQLSKRLNNNNQSSSRNDIELSTVNETNKMK